MISQYLVIFQATKNASKARKIIDLEFLNLNLSQYQNAAFLSKKICMIQKMHLKLQFENNC